MAPFSPWTPRPARFWPWLARKIILLILNLTVASPGGTAVFDPNVKTGGCYHPRNFDQQFRGPVRLEEALGQSINVPAVKVLYLAGLKDTLETASRFGITTLTDPNRYGLSLVLGGGEIKLVELVGAYSALAADGVKHEPVTILRIENSRGDVLEEYKENEGGRSEERRGGKEC